MSGQENEREKIMAIILDKTPFGITRPALDRLELFVTEYLHWGSRIHIVSRLDPGGSLAAQIVESLYMLDFAMSLLPEGGQEPLLVADIGTGYGFPGLVWSLMREDLDMTLIDRKEKCVTFLEMLVPGLGAEKTRVVRADAGRSDIQKRFDLVTTKAAGRLFDVIPLVTGLMRENGLYITIKGTDWEWELDNLDPRGLKLLSKRDLPGMTGVLLAFGSDGPARPQ